jgi:hypothetical protein
MNCFSGSIPAEICLNYQLREMFMDGLHAAQSCSNAFHSLPWMFGISATSVLQSNAIGGLLPSCIFDSYIQFVSLSGNGLVGSIPQDVEILSLISLDLSHNGLTGSIPHWLFGYGVLSLDLSFNRLTGTIPEDAVEFPTSMSLQVNLLSGILPKAWVELASINVLTGNMFTCEYGVGPTVNTPKYDPDVQSYQCGSQDTNIALLCFVVLLFMSVLGLLWMARVYDMAAGDILLWVDKKAMYHMGWLIVLLCCSMGLYAGLLVGDRSYANQYIWTVALFGQQGTLAAVVLFCWLMCWQGQILVWCWNAEKKSVEGKEMEKKESVENSLWCRISSLLSFDVWKKPRWLQNVSICGLILVNIVVVLVINGLYVMSATQQWRRSVLSGIVLLISLFKIVWSAAINHVGLSGMLSICNDGKVEWLSDYLIVINVFNNILAPLMTELFVSPNCLKYLFTSISVILIQSLGSVCEVSTIVFTYDGGNTSMTSYTDCISLPTSSYTAAFSYNFQYSSSMLQNFAYVFIYRCLYNVFLVPVLWMCLKRWQQWSFERYGTSSAWFKAVTMCLPMMLRPLSHSTGNVQHMEATTSDSANRMEEERRYFNWSIFVVLINKGAERGAEKLRIPLLTDLSILLSYGVLFPPLGLLMVMAMGVDVLTTVYMMRRLDLLDNDQSVANCNLEENISGAGGNQVFCSKEYQTKAKEEYQQVRKEMIDCATKAFAGVKTQFVETVPLVLSMVVLLWAFALFDVLGRDVGVIHAVWIIVVTCLFSYLLHFIMYIVKTRTLLLPVCDVTSNCKRKDMESGESTVEIVVMNPLKSRQLA